MRLPSKIEVNNAVASQRKKDIDEGVFIARKVDALRQTLASLQQQHDTFVAGMEGELKRRTEYLISQSATLEKYVLELEEKKKQLRVPLDDEWKKVQDREIALNDSVAKLSSLESKLNQREHIQDERDRKSKEVLARVKARDRASSKAYEQAEATKHEAETITSALRTQKENKQSEYEAKDKEYEVKEQSLVSYEFTLKMREEHIDMKEQEIREERIRLSDQRATLERALARLNKK